MTQSYSNTFLIPVPVHEGSYFDGTLTFVCRHTPEGALGLMVNRPTGFDLNTLLKASDLSCDLDSPPPIFEGGPVHQGAPNILHTDDCVVSSTLPLPATPGVAYTPPTDLEAFKQMLAWIAENKGPSKFLVALGYAGWHDGQLDREVNDNVWLTCPGSEDIIFDTPIELRADIAADSIGVDLSLLSGSADGVA